MKPVIGTREYPFIDMAPHLDMAGLIAMLPDIMAGIAESRLFQLVVSNTLDRWHSRATGEKMIEGLPANHPHRIPYDRLIADSKDENPQSRFSRNAVVYANLMRGHFSGCLHVPLTRLRVDKTFGHIWNPDACEPGPDQDKFPFLMDWVRKMPMESVGRITLIMNCNGSGMPIHHDGSLAPHRNEFVWFNLYRKAFFVYDRELRTKRYAQSDAVMFDDRQWHGSNVSPDMSLSFRVDGKFTEEFKTKVGLAGLDSYWSEGIPYHDLESGEPTS